MNITESQFRRCLPKITDERVRQYFQPFRTGFMQRGFNRIQTALFLTQIGHESLSLSVLQESLNYSVQGLLALFSRQRISAEQAQALGRIPGRPANQQAIANAVYGGEFGRRNLGNIRPGDGWLYRGRGPKQITGRANYRRASEDIYKDLRLLENPDLLLQPEPGVLATFWFWDSHGMGRILDLEANTRRLNGGLNGIEDRQRRYDISLAVLR
jgi:putative chitinase